MGEDAPRHVVMHHQHRGHARRLLVRVIVLVLGAQEAVVEAQCGPRVGISMHCPVRSIAASPAHAMGAPGSESRVGEVVLLYLLPRWLSRVPKDRH